MYLIRPCNAARIATRAVSNLTWQSTLLPGLEICIQLPGTLRQADETPSSKNATGIAARCFRYSWSRGFASEAAPEEPMSAKDEKVKVTYKGCSHLARCLTGTAKLHMSKLPCFCRLWSISCHLVLCLYSSLRTSESLSRAGRRAPSDAPSYGLGDTIAKRAAPSAVYGRPRKFFSPLLVQKYYCYSGAEE